MSIRTALVAAFFVLVTVFALVNWSAFMAPTHLSLLVTSVDAPLGLIMLGFTSLIAAVLLSLVFRAHLVAMADRRRLSAELRQQRELASQAEASRLTELQRYIGTELGSLRQAQEAALRQLHEELTAATNTLAACIGEVDERLERQMPTRPAAQP